jgi:hypothetical protein
MRTLTKSAICRITIPAKHAKTAWITLFSQPPIKIPPALRNSYCFTMSITAAVYMINCEKLQNLFPTTKTMRAALTIMRKNLNANFPTMSYRCSLPFRRLPVSTCCSNSFCRSLIPFRSFRFHLLWQTRISQLLLHGLIEACVLGWLASAWRCRRRRIATPCGRCATLQFGDSLLKSRVITD